MTEHRLVTDAEAEKVQHVAEAVGFFTHTCGYQPGCLCTEMYPARIKRLLATRAALMANLEDIWRAHANGEDEDFWTIRDTSKALLAELHGEKP